MIFPKDWQIQQVPCVVHTNLSYAEEASIFRRLNSRVSVTYAHDWKLRVIAGEGPHPRPDETAAVEITAILKEYNLVVGERVASGCVRAPRALDRIYNHGGGPNKKVLRDTLALITRTWNVDADALDGFIIEGLGLLFIKEGETIDFDAMVRSLAKHGTPAKLLGEARTAGKLHHKGLARAVAGIAVDLYNRRRRNGGLDSWW